MNAENLNVTAGTANLQTQVPGAPATVSSAAEVTGGVAAGSLWRQTSMTNFFSSTQMTLR